MTITTAVILILCVAFIFYVVWASSRFHELRRDIDRNNEWLKLEDTRLADRHWDLWHKHDRLMRHLNLEEVKQATPIVRKKK